MDGDDRQVNPFPDLRFAETHAVPVQVGLVYVSFVALETQVIPSKEE
jgi:hypothetical protein